MFHFSFFDLKISFIAPVSFKNSKSSILFFFELSNKLKIKKLASFPTHVVLLCTVKFHVISLQYFAWEPIAEDIFRWKKSDAGVPLTDNFAEAGINAQPESCALCEQQEL